MNNPNVVAYSITVRNLNTGGTTIREQYVAKSVRDSTSFVIDKNHLIEGHRYRVEIVAEYGKDRSVTNRKVVEFGVRRNSISNIVISSAHSLYVSGSVGIINEVEESRRVVPEVVRYLRQLGVNVFEFHDDVSRNQSNNVNAIVEYHNGKVRDLDVSVHFNSVSGGTTEEGYGVEVCYRSKNTLEIAQRVAQSISNASGLILRRVQGAYLREDLGFLNNTTAPAILIEVCFVNSVTDVRLYNQNFDAICRAIARALVE